MRVVCFVLLLAALAGCGGAEPGGSPAPGKSPAPGRSPAPGASGVAVTLVRTGGIAGVEQRVEVTPEGRWTYTEQGRRRTGQLSSEQVAKLQSLATDERLPTEAGRQDSGECADGFQYRLRAGSLSLTAVDCGGFSNRPAFAALVGYLVDVTPM